MNLQLETGAIRLLEMLKKEAPNMSLGRAYNYVKEHQEMKDDLGKYEFIIMMLLKAVGVNSQGLLSDKETAEKLKDMPDEVWNALRLANTVHAGFSCNPFMSKDWVQKTSSKVGANKEDIDRFKESQLSVVLKNDSYVPDSTCSFSSSEECEKEAISFTENNMKVVGGLLSDEYKLAYKEGIEHYLRFKNNL